MYFEHMIQRRNYFCCVENNNNKDNYVVRFSRAKQIIGLIRRWTKDTNTNIDLPEVYFYTIMNQS